MDNFTYRKINELAKIYLRGNDGPLVSLGEINKDYLRLFPLIKDITYQIVEEKRAEVENRYQEELDNLKKDYEKNFEKSEEKWEKIKRTWKDLNQNKKKLIDLLDEPETSPKSP